MTILTPCRVIPALLLGMALVLAPGCGGKKAKAETRGSFPDANGVQGTAAVDGTNADGSIGATDSGQMKWTPDNETAPGESSLRGGLVVDGNAPDGLPESSKGEEMPIGAPIPELVPVYFGYDSATLDESATVTLDRNAAYLVENAGLKVVLRGHTDDRGTEEYNIALGQSRAQVVRDYLVTKKVAGDRLTTVSFGKSMPASDGTDDAARQKNRRVEFFVYTEE